MLSVVPIPAAACGATRACRRGGRARRLCAGHHVQLRDRRRRRLPLECRRHADLHAPLPVGVRPAVAAARLRAVGDDGERRRTAKRAPEPEIENVTGTPATGRSLWSRTSTTGAVAVFWRMMLTAPSPSSTTIFSAA